MSAPHSPGPWRLTWEDDRRAVVAADGGRVVHRGGITSSQEWDGIPILEANERLIAAAPELLAVLENVIDSYWRPTPGTIGGDYADDLRALIARIRGE